MRQLCILVIAVLFLPAAAGAQMRGHGGPVRALAVSGDGREAVSGSFDQSAILWSVNQGTALAVWRFHDGAVNAVAALPDGRFATGGEDGRIAVWRPGAAAPERTLQVHEGPIVGLAVSPDGAAIGSASWDGTARITALTDGTGRILAGHQGNVNGIAFLPDGRPVTVGYDGTLRIWPLSEGSASVHTFPTPLNAVAVSSDGEVVAAGADGLVRFVAADGATRNTVEAGSTPVIALAVSPDGSLVAAAAIGGSVAIIDRVAARIRFSLVGPGLPVWSLAFRPDGRELLTGGSDRLVRRWSMHTGDPVGPLVIGRPEDFLASFRGDRGAEVFRACAACHTLTPDGGNRAGPTLHGIMGRRIASAPGYNYSPALQAMDIVWNTDTIARMFEVGPSRYTPGTKMPEQTISDRADREALVRFLERATR